MDSREDYTCRIIGIDPGSTTLGVAVLEYDAKTLEITRSYTWTINANKLQVSELDTETHSDRYARIFALSEALYQIFVEYSPNFVATESPFLKRRFPLSFAVLTEVVFAIRLAVRRYDPTVVLELVSPMGAKGAVGAKTVKGGDQKKPVHDALKALQVTLCFDAERSGMSLNDIDEHSVDSLAVGYYKWLSLFE